MEERLRQIIDLARKGNMGAMRTLYDMNREKIMNLAYRYTRNREDAEEILHDTFITAFSALRREKLRDAEKFPSWLYRIGMNTSIDFLRREKKHRWRDLSGDEPDEAAPGDSPEEGILKTERDEQISRALSRLSPKQRMVFTLKHFQLMKIREIAETLQCSEGNVKTQLFRAVRSLRKKLAKAGGVI